MADQRKTPIPWEAWRFPCIVDWHGELSVAYYSSDEAMQEFPPDEIARFLEAVGYYKIANGIISRIDKTDWISKVERSGFVGRRREGADLYRNDFSNDTVQGVPDPILRCMDYSCGVHADTSIRLKSEILKHYRNQTPHETTAMTTTQDTPITPDEETKALALEAMPMKVVIVTFPGSDKEYHYFAPAEPGKAQPGDYCVVYGNNNPTNQPRSRDEPLFSIGIIQRETPDFEGRAKGAILGVFNEAFAKHVQARMDMLASVKARLQVKRKQFEDTQFYEMLAEKDPEARELLDQLKQFRV